MRNKTITFKYNNQTPSCVKLDDQQAILKQVDQHIVAPFSFTFTPF